MSTQPNAENPGRMILSILWFLGPLMPTISEGGNTSNDSMFNAISVIFFPYPKTSGECTPFENCSTPCWSFVRYSLRRTSCIVSFFKSLVSSQSQYLSDDRQLQIFLVIWVDEFCFFTSHKNKRSSRRNLHLSGVLIKTTGDYLLISSYRALFPKVNLSSDSEWRNNK